MKVLAGRNAFDNSQMHAGIEHMLREAFPMLVRLTETQWIKSRREDMEQFRVHAKLWNNGGGNHFDLLV